MNVTMTKIDDVNANIVIELEEKDYQDQIKKTLREISMNRPEPGFRPGKTPAGLLQKKYGKAVKTDVLNKEVADALYNYIKENDVQVLGNPVPVPAPDFSLDQKDYRFEFKVGIAPAIDTHVNKEMHIPYYTIEVSDEMIQKQDEMLRRRFGKQVPGEEVEPNALVKGVITELDAEGKPLEGGIVVENGILSPEYFKNQEQKDLFVGKKVGDVITFNPAATCDANEAELSSMLGISKEETAGHHGDFTMEIKEIIVLKPAEDGEEFFTEAFGKDQVHDAEEYKNAIKAMISSQLENDSNFRFTIDGKKVIVDAVGQLTLPDEVLKDYLKQSNEALTDDNIDEEYAKLRGDLEWQLIREAVNRQLEVKVTQDDLKAFARRVAMSQLAQYGMANAPEQMLDSFAQRMLDDANSREQIVHQVADSRMWAAIKEAVSVDDKSVSVEQFNELFKDMAPAAEA